MKATRIYLIRHGEVDCSGLDFKDGAVIGSLDLPLNNKGVNQMVGIGTALRKSHIHAVYTSCLKRSHDSGSIIAGVIDSSLPVRTVAELNEADLGEWEGLAYPVIMEKHGRQFGQWLNNMLDFKGHGGESIQDVCKRVIPVFEKIIKLNQGKNIAIVLHGLVNRLIIAYILQMKTENLFSIEQTRGGTNIIDIYKDGKGVVKGLNLMSRQLSEQVCEEPLYTHLVVGGAKSGKSTYALLHGSKWSGEKIFIATAEAGDDEMNERVKRHQEERGSDWITCEEPLDIVKIINSRSDSNTLILVDCLTMWINNLLMAKENSDLAADDWDKDVFLRLKDALERASGPVILVSNEVGQGIVPANALARKFRDMQGRLNQIIGGVADRVTMLVAGVPVNIK